MITIKVTLNGTDGLGRETEIELEDYINVSGNNEDRVNQVDLALTSLKNRTIRAYRGSLPQ